MEELHNIPIAVQKSDYVVEFLEEHHPDLLLTKYELQDNLLKDLKENKILVLAYDVPHTMYFINRFNLMGKYRFMKRLYSTPLSHSVAKGNGDLVKFIDSGMTKISEKEREDLNNKWIHYDLPPLSFKVIIQWISIATGAIIFIFFFISYFLLKMQVQRKTTDLQFTLVEKENLIKDLQIAISNIKTLEGMVPICANCKKIRNDEGFWEQIETYVQNHTDADFSHGICPNCEEKLYGDEQWFKNKKK